jgi:hypothetical protein
MAPRQLENVLGDMGPIPVADVGFEFPARQSRALRSELLWVWLPTGVLVGVVAIFRHSWSLYRLVRSDNL